MVRSIAIFFAALVLAAAAKAQLTQPKGASAVAGASSRYVRDGAASPVAWEAWGSRAFERSRREQRPIFLAIGYAAPYEVFRMQREAFVNGEIAEMLNAYFVPVLLDRLEYPETAESYATIARSMGADAGVPLLLLLTPSLEPFAAAAYTAPSDLNRLLVINANRWAHEREAVLTEAARNVEKARALGEKRAPAPVEPSLVQALAEELVREKRDETSARAMAASLLLRFSRDLGVSELRALAASPLHDHLGGGFHRKIREGGAEPHFEKMLADQALVAIAAVEAWQRSGEADMERLARSTVDAAIRDLRDPRGGFYASQDAHNLVPAQGPEFSNGAFYVWDRNAVTQALGGMNGEQIFRLFGIGEGPRNVLTLADPGLLADEEVAAQVRKVLDYRQKRPQPFRDFSIMSGYNGLMISALARAGAAFGEKTYTDTAIAAARVVTSKLWNERKKTLHRSDAGTTPHVEALPEDYAMLVQGLLDLFEATHDVRWLELSTALQQRMDQLFWDESSARYASASTVPAVLQGLTVASDVGTPDATSIAAMNLLRLSMLVPNEAWRARPAMIFHSFGIRLRNEGVHLPQLAAAYSASLAKPVVVVVTGEPRKPETLELLASYRRRWEPLRFVLYVPDKGPVRERLVGALPFLGALVAAEDAPRAYECSGGECRSR